MQDLIQTEALAAYDRTAMRELVTELSHTGSSDATEDLRQLFSAVLDTLADIRVGLDALAARIESTERAVQR